MEFEMKKTARLRAIIAALLVVFSLQMLVYAEEQPLLISAPVEQPDAWALDAVQWSAIYGLAPQELYAKYKSKATREELCTVCVSVYERLTGDVIIPVEESPFSDTDSLAVLKAYKIGILTETEKFEPQKEATRMEMVTGVYNVIKAAQPEFDFSADVNLTFKDIDTIPQNSLDIVKYSVSKGILNGRSKEILDLQSTCTRQELLVFAKNAYEFAVYESGRDSKGAFWKVTDEDSTVYLLGSIHLADPTLYPLSKDILKAYEQSDYLVVEANVSNLEETSQYMLQRGMYEDENTLDQNIPEDLYNAFVEFITPYGVQEEIYNKLKPWYAALLVQNLQLAENSYSGILGVDVFFLSKATDNKDILEIEGVKFQVDMFDSFSQDLQCLFLASVLPSGQVNEGSEIGNETDNAADQTGNMNNEEAQTSLDLFSYMLKCWKEGNTEELAKMVKSDGTENGELKEFNEKIWTLRDNNMAEKVRSYLADPEKKTYFVVVGAGHMVGENGVVAQLEDEFKIEQIR